MVPTVGGELERIAYILQPIPLELRSAATPQLLERGCVNVIGFDAIKDHAGARWAKPELVAEVAFTEWTRDGRLRHPRYQGLRDDKPAREVIREEPSR